jgi:2TM domain
MTSTSTSTSTSTRPATGQQPVRFDKEDDLRGQAVTNLKKRRDLAAHLLVYLLVNGFIVVIWAVTSAGFFWPIFPMAGWGIGLVMNAWDVYRGDRFSEDSVRREMGRLSAR